MKKLTLLLIGLDKSGKTTFWQTLDGIENLENYYPTNGCEIYEMNKDEKATTKYKFIDFSGSAMARSVWADYYTEKDAIFYFIDASDSSRYDESCANFRVALDHEANKDSPIFIMYNKIDIAQKEDLVKLKAKVDILIKSRKNLIKTYEISCLKNENLKKSLEDIAKAYTETCLLAPKPTVAERAEKGERADFRQSNQKPVIIHGIKDNAA